MEHRDQTQVEERGNMPDRSETHIITGDCGHIEEIDCWCEPFLYLDEDTNELIVEHDDHCGNLAPLARQHILEQRNETPDWITRLLNSIEG